MPRTTVSEVDKIIDTSLDSTSISEWLDIAHEKVDEIAAADPSIGSSKLTKIEQLLTAHLVSTQDQRHSKASGGSRSASYQGQTGMGINGTKHGQQAAMLDPTGILQSSYKPGANLSTPDTKGIQ